MIDRNFKLAIQILNKKKIDYWVCHGTLLGLVRDKKLIEWDNDIDIGVIKKKKILTKIEQFFKKSGFKKKKKFFINDGLLTFVKKGGREVDINFYKTYFEKKNKKTYVICQWYIPKNIFFKIIDAISNATNYRGKFKIIINYLFMLEKLFIIFKKILIKNNFFYKKIGYSHPISFIKKKKVLKLQKLSILTPFNSQKYLQYIYGKNWRVPKKNYIWYYDSPSLKTNKDYE